MNIRRWKQLVLFVLICFAVAFLLMKRRQRFEGYVMTKKKLEDLQPVLDAKVDDLKRKLNDAEYISSSISQELASLNTAVQKVLPANKTQTVLSFPGIYNLMPHLVTKPHGLNPKIHIGAKKRRKVAVAFGIPSIARERQSYLLGTLQSLLHGLSEEDKADVVLVVFIGDPPTVAAKRVDEVKAKFPIAIEEGILEIIVPHPDFYPDMSNLPLSFNDPPERVRWRTKQNLDYSYLMMYAYSKARFYCQLEDDIVATMSYASTIHTFALQQEANEWFMLEFSSLGFIGKLFKSSDVLKMVSFFLTFYKEKPVDWLLDHILWVKVCNPEKDAKHCNAQKQRLKIRFKPSLFQHIGKLSSLKGKRQSLVDKDFKNQPLFQAHLNPKAVVKTSFETYQRYTAEAGYLGQTFFWGLTPHAGDVIRFCFQKPTWVERYKFRTGMTDHPGDILVNATVEALTQRRKEEWDHRKHQVTEAETVNLEDKENAIQNEYRKEDYVTVGKFTPTGLASGKISNSIGPLAELRIRVLSHKKENWVALSEIHIVEKHA